MESLESRCTPAVNITFVAGLLTVTGDSNANDLDITFSEVSSLNYLVVKDGGVTIYDGTPSDQNVLVGDVTAISVVGGAGDDVIDLSDVTVANGFSLEDESISLDGGADNDTIIGSEFFDIIRGGSGNDSLLGGGGDDQYWFADNAGTNIINDTGGDTLDALFFVEFSTSITVDLSLATAQTVATGTTITIVGTSIEAVVGSNYNDTLKGHSGFNLLAGFGGDDTLEGGGGDDWYFYFDDSQGSDLIIEAADQDADLLVFSGYSSGITINLSLTSAQSIGGSTTITLSSSTGIEGVIGSDFADTFTGNARDNYFIGGAGDDTYIFGSTGQGSDYIEEEADADLNDKLQFNGAAGSITIDLSSTSAQNWGGGTITLSSSTGIERVSGSSYADTITGNARNNQLDGSAGNDTIFGGAGIDIMFGSVGDDSLIGGGGDDQYAFFHLDNGSDIIVEEADADNDTLTFGIADVGITIDVSSTSAQSWGDGTITLSTSTSIETVIGSDYADLITGNARDNILFGYAGNDTILGGDGYDIISGDGGNDSLLGGDGSDLYLFYGGPSGTDVIVEASSAEVDAVSFEEALVGVTFDLSSTSAQSWGDGTITLANSNSIEWLVGSPFADSLVGSDGDDYIAGRGGNDTIVAGGGDDYIEGDAGDDSLVGGDGSDGYGFGAGPQGNDVIVEGASADSNYLDFASADGSVSIDIGITSAQSWGNGAISLSDATSIQVVIGSPQSDTIIGNALDNAIFGMGGADSLVGGEGDDQLDGGSGNDTIHGGSGDDLLWGGEGDDSLVGGTGSDIYFFEAAPQGTDQVVEDANSDSDLLYFAFSSTALTIDLSSTSTQSWGNGTITLSTDSSIERVLGTDYADYITGNARDNILNGGAGNDTILGAAGDDTLNGGSGDDSLIGGTGSDWYIFGSVAQGADSIVESASADHDLLDFSRADVGINIDISSTSGQNWGDGTITLSDSTGIEHIIGSSQNDVLIGNDRDNVIIGGAGNDSIDGAAGNDAIDGGFGNDTLLGGSGRDLLAGGIGADSLLGGDGDDILASAFVYFGDDFETIADAIDQVLAEWTSGGSYATRVANVQASTGASDPLPLGVRLRKDETLSDVLDSSVDTLEGGNGDDLFFYDAGEDLTDAVSGEDEIDIS